MLQGPLAGNDLLHAHHNAFKQALKKGLAELPFMTELPDEKVYRPSIAWRKQTGMWDGSEGYSPGS